MSYIDYTKCSFDTIKESGGVAFLGAWSTHGAGLCRHASYEEFIDLVDIYEDIDSENFWDKYKILAISMGVDQLWLKSYKQKFQAFLDKGGVILNFAATFTDFCPYDNNYIASEVPIRIREIKLTEHEICKGIREYDINYRRGVKGFFCRGFKKAPKGAEIFLKDSENECVAYIDTKSSKGIFINTAGADLLTYGLFDASTARRLGFNLLLYVEKLLGERKNK